MSFNKNIIALEAGNTLDGYWQITYKHTQIIMRVEVVESWNMRQK